MASFLTIFACLFLLSFENVDVHAKESVGIINQLSHGITKKGEAWLSLNDNLFDGMKRMRSTFSPNGQSIVQTDEGVDVIRHVNAAKANT